MIDKIKVLREKTGKPLSECKKALEACAGNEKKALLWLTRKQGEDDAAGIGYRFDRWIDDLSQAIVRGIEHTCPADEAVGLVHIDLDDLSLWPLFVIVHTPTNRFEFQPYGDWDSDGYLIPQTVDDDDRVLKAFFARHLRNAAFAPERFTIGDRFRLPGALWRYSLIRIEEAVKQQLSTRPVGKAADFDVVARTAGEIVRNDKESLLSIIAAAVKKNLADPALCADFAGICYDFEADRKWLMAFM